MADRYYHPGNRTNSQRPPGQRMINSSVNSQAFQNQRINFQQRFNENVNNQRMNLNPRNPNQGITHQNINLPPTNQIEYTEFNVYPRTNNPQINTNFNNQRTLHQGISSGMNNQGGQRADFPLNNPSMGATFAGNSGDSQSWMSQQIPFSDPQQRGFNPLAMQRTQMPHTTMAQPAIVQHVMIPIPVPIGTNIPAHLLTPRIINTSAPIYSSQQQFTNNQNQQNFQDAQLQFQASQNQFSGVQSHHQFSNTLQQNQNIQTQNQNQNFPDQFSGSKIQPSNSAGPYNNPGNELSYYIGSERRSESKTQSMAKDEFQSHSRMFTGKSNDERKPPDRWIRNEQEFENVYHRKQEENTRHFSRSPVSHLSGQQMGPRNEFYEEGSKYASKEVNRYESDRHRERNLEMGSITSSYMRDDRTARNSGFERSHQADDQKEQSKISGRTGRQDHSAREYVFERGSRETPHHKYDFNTYRSQDLRVNETSPRESDRSGHYSKEYSQKERQSNLRNELDGRHMEDRMRNRIGEYEDTRAVDQFEDRLSSDRRNLKNIENLGTDRGFNEVYRREIDREDEYRVERTDHGKRKTSPVMNEEFSRKVRRDYSPVSENKSHHELKIHVSDRGRWIETDDYTTPVSEKEFDIDEPQVDHQNREMINDRVYVSRKMSVEMESVKDTELVSDSESYIEEERVDNLRIHANNLSPVSVDSSPVNQNIHDDSHSYKEGRQSPSHSYHSQYSGKKVSEEEPRSPSASHQSRRSQHSHHSKYSLDKKSLVQEENKFASDKTNVVPQADINDCLFKVPKLCIDHNRKSCHKPSCVHLHICKHFIYESCKFGDNCTKSHEFMSGPSFWLLNRLNPGFMKSRIKPNDVKMVVKNRLGLCSIPPDVVERLNSYQAETVYRKSKVNDDEDDDIGPVDPSFDARNYVVQTDVVTQASDKKRGESGKKFLQNNESTNGSKNKANGRQVPETKSSVGTGKKTSRMPKRQSSDKDPSLSPVSGDEDDWEKYETYEQVSDEEEDVIEDQFENVSSNDSTEEQVMSPVNRALDSFPIPTPENIAVPIGMNDPLVFNRPLKNNPQSYIGPMNRPPPSFPISTNTPLFPSAAVAMPTHGIAVAPVIGVGGTPQMANHLPSPEFMKHVIQSLPTFKIETGSGQNAFKNDNTPTKIETDIQRKKTLAKVERDPELKETIKELWTFPHKSVINMSIIEFVTETDAYKEELIAEIVRILVTIELPYVTMKKLLAVIKEKISINIKSEADLKKILEMYPNNFRIIEQIDSDDEDSDCETKRSIQIKANIKLGFCEKHGFLPFAVGNCDCNALHLCKFYFLSDCTSKHCKFGHKLKTDHNIKVLKQHKLHRLTGEEIMNYLVDVDNRNKETIPGVCKYYIREKGCYKGDNTDFETICHSLHLCSYILKGKCMNRECQRSHSIRNKQPLSLLQKFGLDPDELGDEKVLQMLGESAFESEKQKGRKITPTKPAISGKPNVKNVKARMSSSSSKSEALENREDLEITRTETKISSKYFVQNFRIPSICKFYNNETGCRKKDWGPDGKCYFLHICQYFVTGDCKFGEKCKRSHDLFSGQAAEILLKYNFDIENLTAGQILERLNSSAGVPVEIPKDGGNSASDKIEISVEINPPTLVQDMTKVHTGRSSVIKTEDDYTRRGSVIKTEHGHTGSSTVIKSEHERVSSGSMSSGKKTETKFSSSSIEDMIKHIMEKNKVDTNIAGNIKKEN